MVDWLLPQVNHIRCTGCGFCEIHCPEHAVQMMDGDFPTFIYPESCSYCGSCEDVCLAQAITLVYEIRPAPANGSTSPDPI